MTSKFVFIMTDDGPWTVGHYSADDGQFCVDSHWNHPTNASARADELNESVPDDSPCGCHIEQPHRGPAPHSHPEGEQS